MKKLDIVYFGNMQKKNGAIKVIENLVEGKEYFKLNGIDVNKLYTPFNNLFQPQETKKNLKDKNLKIKIFLKKTYLGSILSIYLQYIRHSKKVVNIYLNEKNTNIVMFHDIFSAYYFLKKRKDNRKVILILHTNGDTFSMLEEYFPRIKNSIYRKFFLKRVEKSVLEKVNKINFVSREAKELFIKLQPKYSHKVSFIYNGINYSEVKERVNKEENITKLVCVGSINKRKGQDLIIDTLIRLKDRIKNKIKVVFIGIGSELEVLKNISEKNKLNVEFFGFKENIREILLEMDTFILTSRDEGLPIAMLEALEVGLPIIATDVGGTSEIVENDYNGKLIKNINELDKIFIEILENKFPFKEFSKNSKKIFRKKFTQEAMIKSYAELLKEM